MGGELPTCTKCVLTTGARQYEFDIVGEKWTCVKYKENHIAIHYFKEKVNSGEVDIKYCPTEAMVADYFTKLLEGGLFRLLWDQIMGFGMSSPYHSRHRSVLGKQQSATELGGDDGESRVAPDY